MLSVRKTPDLLITCSCCLSWLPCPSWSGCSSHRRSRRAFSANSAVSAFKRDDAGTAWDRSRRMPLG